MRFALTVALKFFHARVLTVFAAIGVLPGNVPDAGLIAFEPAVVRKCFVAHGISNLTLLVVAPYETSHVRIGWSKNAFANPKLFR